MILTKAQQLKKDKSDRTKKLKAWSVSIRSVGKCEVCGKTSFLNAHHLLSKTQYPHLSTEPKNGICVCPSCHKFGKLSFHKNGMWAAAWLKKNKPLKYKWVMEQLGVI